MWPTQEAVEGTGLGESRGYFASYFEYFVKVGACGHLGV